ncbi:3-methyl-2-oxobutanoate hydroxymethyltransferase [Mesorhizobium sp. NPDC059054]|uniref:3-methyl-2-oxobutanoate hydroxymethyltransferase n=1 Tax=Mesorhizobium sp. NPDC059054 TaxID=3346711 RepID=UPI00367E3121
MRNIYTYGRQPAQRNYTIPDLRALKYADAPLTMCFPGDATELAACVEAGIETLTVLDSNLVEFRRLAPTTFMATSMAWGQNKTPDDILRHAIGCMELGADMYLTNRSFGVVEMLAKEKIPVQVHVGLVPSFSVLGGGLRAYGRTADEAMEIYRTFKRYEDAGAVAAEVECVAEEAMKHLNANTSLVTISLGSGRAGDIIFQFMSDLCGETEAPPKHAYAFCDLKPLHAEIYKQRVTALTEFRKSSIRRQFPFEGQNVRMHANEEQALIEVLSQMKK